MTSSEHQPRALEDDRDKARDVPSSPDKQAPLDLEGEEEMGSSAARSDAHIGVRPEEPRSAGDTFICPICGGNDDDQQLMCEACGGVGLLGTWGDDDGATEGLSAAGWVGFNLNNAVRVRLAEVGLKRLRANHDAVFAGWPEPPVYREPQPEENGWYRMQLWTVMQELGGSIVMGCPVPFETTIQLPAEHLSGAQRSEHSPQAPDELLQEIIKLREALRPFAKALRSGYDHLADDVILEVARFNVAPHQRQARCGLRMSDFRRAQALVSSHQGEGNGRGFLPESPCGAGPSVHAGPDNLHSDGES